MLKTTESLNDAQLMTRYRQLDQLVETHLKAAYSYTSQDNYNLAEFELSEARRYIEMQTRVLKQLAN
jgi:hypothetical protein